MNMRLTREEMERLVVYCLQSEDRDAELGLPPWSPEEKHLVEKLRALRGKP